MLMLHNACSYVYLLLYVLFWAVTCYRYYRTVKFTTGLLIILSYLSYGILAYFLYDNEYYGNNYNDLRLFPFIYLYVLLYIFLLPIFKYERRNVIFINIPSNRIINIFLIVYGFSSLVVLPNTLSSLKEGLTILFLDSYGGTELYITAKENHTVREAGVAGVYGLFAIIHNIFGDVVLFLISYYLTIKNKNKYLLFFLAVVVIADLLYPLSKGGRTDFVMKFFAIIMAISIFYPFYSKQIKLLVKRTSIILSLIIFIPFMAMTISRFGERDGGTSGGMLLYIAQAPLNFNNYAMDNGGIRNGDRTMNLFKQLAGMNPPKDIGEVRLKYSHHKMDDSIFSTYVGDFVLDFGPICTFLIFIFISIFFFNKIKITNKTVPFHSLLIIYFIACVAMQGGMYLFNYSFMYNLNILAFICTYWLFVVVARTEKCKKYITRDI